MTSKGVKEWVRFVIGFTHASIGDDFDLESEGDLWDVLKVGVRQAAKKHKVRTAYTNLANGHANANPTYRQHESETYINIEGTSASH